MRKIMLVGLMIISSTFADAQEARYVRSNPVRSDMPVGQMPEQRPVPTFNRPTVQSSYQPEPIGSRMLPIQSAPAIAYFNPFFTPCIPGGCL